MFDDNYEEDMEPTDDELKEIEEMLQEEEEEYGEFEEECICSPAKNRIFYEHTDFKAFKAWLLMHGIIW